jgi:predicted nucleic acid-binding protein
MAYVDTSVLVAYYCPEPLSETAERLLRRMRQPSVSALTEVEFASALARKVREKGLTGEEARLVLHTFVVHLGRGLLTRIPVHREHYTVAFNWLTQFSLPLRTLDALHLAIAAASDLELITADRKLSQSARKLGVRHRLLVLR